MCTQTTMLAGSGPVSAMVARELETVRATFSNLCTAWVARDLSAVALAVSRLQDRLVRHMRWEEHNLLANLATRSAPARLERIGEHHLHHASLERDLQRIALLVARREGNAAGSDEELELALAELDIRLDAHAVAELNEVCLELDALEPDAVAAIRATLDEPAESEAT